MALLRTFRGTHQLDAYNGAPGITEVATFGNANCNVSIRFYDNHDSNSCYNLGMSNARFCVVSPSFPTVFSVGSYAPQANFHVQGTTFISSNTSIFGTLGVGTAAPANNAAMQVIGTFRSDYITAPMINTSNGYIVSGWVKAGIIHASNVRSCNITTLYDGPISAGQGTVSCGLLSNATINTGTITTRTVHVQQNAIVDDTVIANTFQTSNGKMVISANGSMANTSISSTGSISANQLTTINDGPINAGNGQVTCGDITASGIVQATGHVIGSSLWTSNNGDVNIQDGSVICGKVQCSGEVSTSILSMSNLVCTSLTTDTIALRTPVINGFPHSLIMACTPESVALTASASSPVCTFYTNEIWTLMKIRASLSSPGSQSTTTLVVYVGKSTVTTNTLTISPGSTTSSDITGFNANAEAIPDNTPIDIFCTAADTGGQARGLKVTFFYISNPTTYAPSYLPNIAPIAVTNITAGAIDMHSIALSFTQVARASSYSIASSPQSTTQVISASPYQFTGLQPGTSYVFTITSANSYGNGEPCNSPIFTTTPDVVTNVVPFAITPLSITFNFTPAFGATSYTIVSSDGIVMTSQTATSSGYQFGGLSPATAYTFTITSMNATGAGGVVQVGPILTSPAAVTNIQLSGITMSNVQLQYTPANGATSYIIASSPPTYPSTTQVTTGTGSNYTFSNLTAGTNYTFTITSSNTSGLGGSASNLSPYLTTPAAVTNINTGAITTSNIQLQYTAAIGANSYTIVSSPPTPPSTTQVATGSNYTFSNLTAGSNYTFTITSSNASGFGGSTSNAVAFQTAPAASTGVNIGTVTNSSVMLSWTGSMGAQSYSVTATTPGLQSRTQTLVSGGTLYGLTANTSYIFTVTSIGPGGIIGGTTAPTASVTTAPAAVTSCSYGTVTNTSIALSWPAAAGAQSYSVVANPMTTQQSFTGTGGTFVGLTDGTSYTFTITSIGVNGAVGGTSPPTPSITTAPAAPTNVAITSGSVTNTSVVLSWSPAAGATSYSVIATTSIGVASIPQTFGSSGGTFNGLSANTSYTFTVTSVSASGSGGTSPPTASITTTPAAVTTVTYGTVTNTSVALVWPIVVNITSYSVVSSPTATSSTPQLLGASGGTFTGLYPNQAYTFTVTPLAANGSPGSALTTPNSITTAPAAVTVSTGTVTNNTVSLSWNAVGGVTYYSTTATTTGMPSISLTQTFSTPGGIFNGLTANTSYTFTVTSIGATGTGGTSLATPSVITAPAAATSLTVIPSSVTNTTAILTWTGAPGAISYMVLATPYGGASTIAPQPLQSGGTFYGLSPNSSYTFTVSSIGVGGIVGGTSSPTQTITTSPDAVTSVSTGTVTNVSVVLTWLAAQGAQSYSVIATSAGVSLPAQTLSSGDTYYGLSPNTYYIFTVTSIGANGIAGTSASSSSVLTAPDAIAQVNVGTVTSSTISLSWTAVAGAQFYNVTATPSVGSSVAETFGTSGGSFTGLSANTAYTFTVTSVGAGGIVGGTSRPTSSITTAPDAPTALAVTQGSITNISAILTWSASAGATSYIVSATPSVGSIIRQTLASGGTFGGLTAYTSYSFTVTAIGAGGISGGTSSPTPIITTAPDAPTGLAVTLSTVTNSAAALTWTGAIGAQSYSVVATSGGISLTPQTLVSGGTFNGLSSYTSYTFTVTSIGANGIVGGTTLPTSPITTAPAAVTGFTVNAQAVLAWTGAIGAQSYSVVATPAVGLPITQTHASGDTFSGLSPNTSYTFTVTSIGAGGIVGGMTSPTASITTAPAAVTSLTVVAGSITYTSVVLNWNGAAGAQSYTVVATSSTAATVTQTLVSGATFNSLTPNTSYTFTVQSIGANGILGGITSSTSPITTAPDAPTGLTVTSRSVTNVQAALTWTGVSGASSYSVTAIPSVGVNITKTLASGGTFTGLSPNTSYTFTVTSIGAGGITGGTSAATQSVTTAPDVPTTLTVTPGSVTNTSVILTWTGVVGAISYSVVATSTGATITQTHVSGDIFTGLLPNTSYTFTVTSIGAGGITGGKTLPTSSITTAPAAVTGIQSGTITSSNIQLQYTAAAGATSYSIVSIPPTPPSTTQITTGSNYTFSNLSPGTSYTFAITSSNASGFGGSASNTTPYLTTPAAVSNIGVTSTAQITSNTIPLSFSAVTGATSYGIVSSPGNLTETTTTSNALFSNLSPGTSYTFAITSSNASGFGGSASNAVSFTTVPAGVTSLFAVPVSSTTASLSWSNANGATMYPITTTPSTTTKIVTASAGALTTCTFSNLIANSNYVFNVTSSNATGIGGKTTSYPATTMPPAAVTALTAVAASSTTATVSWSNSSGATSYPITTIPPTTTQTYIMTGGSLVTSYTFSNLAPSSNYTFTVTPVGLGGSGDSMTSGSIITPSAFSTQYISSGIIGYWDALSVVNNGQSFANLTTLNDISTYANNLTITNIAFNMDSAPAIGLQSSTSATTGIITSPITLSSFTMEVLVKLYNSYGGTLLTLYNNTHGVSMFITSSGQIGIGAGMTAASFAQNTWLHIVITYSRSPTVYVNGIIFPYIGSVTVDSSINQIVIGATSTLTAPFGIIAFARVYNTALTAAQVAVNYNSINYIYTNPSSVSIYPSTTITPSSWLGNNPYTYTIAGNTYDTGTYVASSKLPMVDPQYNMKYLFDGVLSVTSSSTTYFWQTDTWIQIQLPAQIVLAYYVLYPIDLNGTYLGASASSWYLQGSTDGSTWTSISGTPSSPITVGVTSTAGTTIYVSCTSQYSYYRLYMAGDGSTHFLKQWQLFGVDPSNVFVLPTIPIPVAVPSSVTGITPLSITSSNIEIGFNPASTATSYVVSSSPSLTNMPIISSILLMTSLQTQYQYTATGLTPNTSYQLTITAVNAAGYSGAASYPAITSAPAAVTALSAVATSITTAVLSWSNAPGATSYPITTTPFTTTQTASAIAGGTTNYTFSNLTSINGTYTFNVTSVGASGVGDTASSYPITLPPAAVTELTATAASSTTATLSWKNSPGATFYPITTIPSTTAQTFIPIVNGPPTSSYTYSNLAAGTNYTFYVTSSNATAGSGGTASNTTPFITVPAAVSNIAVTTGTPITTTTIPLSFSTVTGASLYTITTGSLLQTTTTSNALFSNLAPGTNYTFAVTSSNASGPGPLASNTTPFITVPAAVTNVTPGIITSSSIAFSFTAASGATSYNVTISPTTTTAPVITGTQYTYAGLSPLTQYTFTITSVNASGSGGVATPQFSTHVVYALDTLSQIAKNNLCGVWSLKSVFTESVGYPVIQLKTSVTGSTYTDFYGGNTGTQLTTASGQSLSTWLAANSISTAYVNTWYDQSYYVNGGTACNATVAGSAGVTLNTSTTPWSVDGSGGGYFNLPNGTVVGNGTCSISCKINLSTSSATSHAMIASAQNNIGVDRNTLAYTYSGSTYSSTYTFINDWGQNVTNSLLINNPTVPLIFTMITYVAGSTQGTYYTGGTSSTNYTQLLYLNKTTTSSQSRSGWSFAPGNDMLMNAPWSGSGGAPLLSQMFYCVNSRYAISDSDRNIIENS